MLHAKITIAIQQVLLCYTQQTRLLFGKIFGYTQKLCCICGKTFLLYANNKRIIVYLFSAIGKLFLLFGKIFRYTQKLRWLVSKFFFFLLQRLYLHRRDLRWFAGAFYGFTTVNMLLTTVKSQSAHVNRVYVDTAKH